VSQPEPTSVVFYVLAEASESARLKLACRIVDKAYRASQNVLIWHTDSRELAQLDELLWTSGDDRNFIPHELVGASNACEAPVLLTSAAVPEGPIDVLINLAGQVPQCVAQAARIVEIIDGDASRRESGRARFKAYRERGLTPVSHNVRAE
jgi:DNA polymerase-3 subunit chi